jgi:hypothetical protein
MWPDCTLVHGKPRHPQSQGSVERGNADIKDMLESLVDLNDQEPLIHFPPLQHD